MTFGLIEIDSEIIKFEHVDMTIFRLKMTLTFDLDLQIILKCHKYTY